MATSHFACYGYPALSTLRPIPHVVHFHGPWAQEAHYQGARRWTTHLKRFVERKVYSSADRYITLSNVFADLLIRDYGVDESKVRVIPGGINTAEWNCRADVSEARQQLNWPQDRPIILCVRRLVRRMGIEKLLDAAKLVIARNPDALFLVVGSGPLRDELLQQIESLELHEHVRLLGYLSDEKLPLAYRAADLSIVPSQSLEGFGLVVIESLAAGTPALVTPVGGLPEAVQALDIGLILNGISSGLMADRITALLSGKDHLPSQSACQAFAQANFDWSTIGPRITEVYREVA